MTEGMHITVDIRAVYGVRAVYPVCEKAYWFTQISQCKTLRPCDIEAIKKLGYEVHVIQPERGTL